jgi:hypothetical protein
MGSFNIGDMISGAVTGFLETGDPMAAGAIGLVDGLTDKGGSGSMLSAMSADSMFSGAADASSAVDIADVAGAFA